MIDQQDPPAMHTEWEWLTKTIYDPAIFWVMVTAIATVLLVVATVALVWVGLIPLLRSRRAELAERIREELLTETVRKLLFLLAHNLVIFVSDPVIVGVAGMGFFRIEAIVGNIFQDRLRQIIGDPEQRIYMTFEIDDLVLNPLQEIAYYERRGSIDFETAFQILGQYFDIVFSNREIQRYLVWIRERRADAFRDAEALYRRMTAHNERENRRGF